MTVEFCWRSREQDSLIATLTRQDSPTKTHSPRLTHSPRVTKTHSQRFTHSSTRHTRLTQPHECSKFCWPNLLKQSGSHHVGRNYFGIPIKEKERIQKSVCLCALCLQLALLLRLVLFVFAMIQFSRVSWMPSVLDLCK